MSNTKEDYAAFRALKQDLTEALEGTFVEGIGKQLELERGRERKRAISGVA